MATLCFTTKEVKRCGPSYHTDLAVHKMKSENSPYVKVTVGASNIIYNIHRKAITTERQKHLDDKTYVRWPHTSHTMSQHQENFTNSPQMKRLPRFMIQ